MKREIADLSLRILQIYKVLKPVVLTTVPVFGLRILQIYKVLKLMIFFLNIIISLRILQIYKVLKPANHKICV